MRKIILFATLLSSALVLLAEDTYRPLNVKTGLWQVTGSHTLSGTPEIPPDMQARMAQMTPEQRARVEEMMRSKFGGAPQTTSYKKCITTKDLNTNPWANGQDENCSWKVVNSTSSDMEVRGSSCAAGKGQGMKTDLTVKLHADDSENVTGSMLGTSTGNGHTVNFTGTYTGKWISSSCPARTD